MSESFELQRGTQREVGGALVGVVGLDVMDGAFRARLAVGVRGDQHRAWVDRGRALAVPGWGTLTLRDVVAAGPGLAVLEFAPAGEDGAA
ncbi:hypothetical protein [Cellulomonas soli]|uniref:Uncharacterized protein n=1 Tax=Cellulomonas soli TaxID=931535 RepID=A0A512P9C6_9CELL|nr:hypothetical protein [Cellulomonas soli]NYI57949.1 hypothetical protein [Cellulomonas soli]GEP67732.1 hypothetical protein CSO01_04470 [Cellulomonas soli]